MKNGYIIPEPGTVEYLEVKPATRGGGWIVNMIVSGKVDTMIFNDANVLTQTLMAMLNGAALRQVQSRQEVPPADVSKRLKPAPKPPLKTEPVKALVPAEPKKKGRPKMTEEQKAAARASRELKKANSAHIPQQAKAA